MTVRNAALYLALRTASVMLPLVPLRLAYALADAVAAAAYYVNAPARRTLEANLRTALGPRADIPALARSAFRTNTRNWLDTLRIARVRADELAELADIEGLDHLERAIEGGHGAVIVSAHLGNFDLVGQTLAGCYRMTIPVERMQPERLFHLLSEERQSKGINVVPVDEAPRRMINALRHGEIVGIMMDGNVQGAKVLVDLLGKPALLPRAPAQLARTTGAALLVGAGIRRAGGRFAGTLAPVSPAEAGSPAEKDLETTQRIATILGDIIRKHPDQWMAFTPVWAASGVPGTIRDQMGAAV